MTGVAFALFSLIAIVAAWRVVTSSDVTRAAVALIITLTTLGPLFLLIGAEFFAIVQVLVYVGAVIVLFLFAIMLTRKPGEKADHDYRHRWPGAIAAAILFTGLWFSVTSAVDRDKINLDGPQTTNEVGRVLLSDQVIAFEAVSILLLAALIGSIALARRD